ncbi:orotate phosphoribosyltransferase [Curvivirga aplysinae]|uniref:orotate phosphoribosyltransferase n=1 Tax=Curvivirga aplysinae TaxID=2529852 RepID=UPI0012BC543F|nr:orotate phosphoribosyltransferase [Curvivirga aplysinae]MTI09742.1 orotate phosphoribosyltransferase [Curvivirga aplysinae]
MQDYKREFIELAMAREVLQFGEFSLKSGRKSPFFFNFGKFHTGKDMSLIGKAYAAVIKEKGIEFDVMFGTAYKGIPIAAVTAAALYDQYGEDNNYCYNRKEAKTHGEGGNIVGAKLEGKTLLVDDVMTAGTAIKEAAGMVQDAGAELGCILIALDRQEKGAADLSAVQEIEKTFDIPVHSIITLSDVLIYLEGRADMAEDLKNLYAYKEQYGI